MNSGRRAGGESLLCFVEVPAPGDGSDRAPRIAVTASKRVGGSVIRNRARRLLREAGRAVLPSLPSGANVVLLALPGIVGKSSSEVCAEVAECIRRSLRPREAPAVDAGAH